MKFVKQAINKETIKLNNGGTYQIDQLYIKDAISAFCEFVDYDNPGSFNVGAGKGFSIKEISKRINEIFENEGNLEIECSKNNESGIERHMDTTKIKKETNWNPKFSLDKGLKDMKKEMLNANN